MKKQIIKFFFLFLAVTSILASCKKEDNSKPDDKGGSSTSAIIISGTWRVSYYHESNNDHTSNFSGYVFAFNTNGAMVSVHSGVTTNGTWSNDDSKNELHLSIGSATPLSDLSKGWLIISKTSTEIVLKDDDSTHNEELHLTRI